MRVTSSTAAFVPASTAPRALTTSSTLKRGAEGEQVKALQQALAREGFDPGSVDGKFGPNTERAVKAFQRANGLTVDGLVGAKTRAALSGGSVPTTPTTPTTPGGDVSTSRTKTSTIDGVSTYKVAGKNGLAFKSGMSIDADGSPRAYNPGNTGLDHLANAGKPGNWWGIATNSSGKPYVQGANDPAPGHYVSTTALVDGKYAASDPRRYVDSEKIPFIAVPPQLRDQGVKLGDLVAVRNDKTGKTVFAVVADIGPKDHQGEGSIKLAQELGINSNARKGGTSSGISYVVFPGSKQTWPMTHEQIQAAGQRAYAQYGGDAQLAAAVR
ncbi:MAG: peptidoglycan-binding protein [Archangium sp.]